MRIQGQKRVPFTVVLWNKWLDRLNSTQSDAQSKRLRSGIDHFRKLCAHHDLEAR